jgi:hypothetical protein
MHLFLKVLSVRKKGVLNIKRYLKILGARRVTGSNLHTDNSSTLFMCPFRKRHTKNPSLTAGGIQGFLAENAFCVFLYICVFTFA